MFDFQELDFTATIWCSMGLCHDLPRRFHSAHQQITDLNDVGAEFHRPLGCKQFEQLWEVVTPSGHQIDLTFLAALSRRNAQISVAADDFGDLLHFQCFTIYGRLVLKKEGHGGPAQATTNTTRTNKSRHTAK